MKSAGNSCINVEDSADALRASAIVAATATAAMNIVDLSESDIETSLLAERPAGGSGSQFRHTPPRFAHAFGDFFESAAGKHVLDRFRELGIDPRSDNYAPKPSEAAESGDQPLAGKTFVITGTLSAPRNEIKEKILAAGGKVTGSISKKTDYLLAGEGGGSKRDKAEGLGVPVISEEELTEILEK